MELRLKPEMFIGEYQHAIDGKGRLAVPAKFRSKLAGKAVITRGLDNCLFIYPLNEWKKLAEKLASLPFSQADTRAFTRLMLAGAVDVEIDRQGRVLVPEYLRNYASLSKETVIAGLFNRLEVWDRESWEKYRTSTEKKAGDIAERLGDLGI